MPTGSPNNLIVLTTARAGSQLDAMIKFIWSGVPQHVSAVPPPEIVSTSPANGA